MASTISLDGLSSPDGETRALAHLTVEYNGNTYQWQFFIPPDSGDLGVFLENSKPTIEAQIDAKELAWANLNPKTRTIPGFMPGEEDTVVDIQKEEIVRPDIPDYYALRRNAYPPIAEQIGAFWKGPQDPDYIAMQAKVLAVKAQYPKL
jgi:hypothetical protein